MFLDEIEKDKIEYAKVCTDKVKECLIRFFGEENRHKIEERIEKNSMIFVDNKVLGYKTDSLNDENSQTNASNCDVDIIISNIYSELEIIYKNWFNQSFENFKLKGDVKLNDLKQFEQFIFEKDFKSAKEKFKALTGSEKVLKKELMQSEALFNGNYYSDIDKLKTLEIRMYNELHPKTTIHDPNRGFFDNKFVKKYIPNTRLTSVKRAYLSFLNENRIHGVHTVSPKLNEENVEVLQFILYNDMRILEQKTFVHEILHGISSSLKFLKTKNNEIIKDYKCGIDREITQLRPETKKLVKANVYLNEVLTDYFAVNITKQMFDDGEKLFLSRLYGCSYSDCFVLTKPLFDKYYEELKFCYLSDSVKDFENLFGEENIEKLNELVEDFSGYSKTYRDKEIPRCETFEEGLKASALPESPFVLPVINKYNNCFKRMDDLMKDIEEYQKTSLNKKTKEETLNK